VVYLYTVLFFVIKKYKFVFSEKFKMNCTSLKIPSYVCNLC